MDRAPSATAKRSSKLTSHASRGARLAVGLLAMLGFGAAASVFAACNVESDFEDKGCPCVPGWTCIEAENRCIADVGVNQADASSDRPSGGEVADAAGRTADATVGTNDAAAPTHVADASRPGDSGGGAVKPAKYKCPPPFGVSLDGGPLTRPEEGKPNCFVHEDHLLRCTNEQTTMFDAARYGANPIDSLYSTFTSFDCFEHGDTNPKTGGKTWYRTCGSQNKVPGFIQSEFLDTHSSFDKDPTVFGLPHCSELPTTP